MSESNTSAPISGTPIDQLTVGDASQQFLDKHQIKIIALVSLLIVAGLVFLVQREIKKSAEESAGALLVLSNEASDLEKITGNFSETAAAGSAKLLLADKQWADGKQDDALATLRGLIDSDESHPARANAMASLAAKLLEQGKTPEAEEVYHKITKDSSAGFLAAYAWISLGDIAVKKGDLEAAAKAYEIVEKDFPETFHSQNATKHRLLMKAEKPVEVAAPAEPLDPKIIDAQGPNGSDVQIQNLIDSLQSGNPGTTPPANTQGNGADK